MPLTPCISPSSLIFIPSTANPRRVRFKVQATSSNSVQQNGRVIIIGAGLAGLAAATRLHSQGLPFLLLEASDAVGGRVRTDTVDGFLLDRGFQIFTAAYPEAQKLLDYDALDLQKFYSGARVYYNGEFHTVADPVRHFGDSIGSLANPIGSFFDKLLIGLNRVRVLSKSDEEIFSSAEVPVLDFLRATGFSDSIIDAFFRPFFGGIFFDKELETSSRLFDFIFKCLALGDNTIPANGICQIPNQLASKLPSQSILLNTEVVSVDFDDDDQGNPNVRLANGETLTSEIGIVLAVEEPEVDRLLAGKGKKKMPPVQKKPARSTVCLYFTDDRDNIPVHEPILFLNGSGTGIVNNMFFATNVAPSYAPQNKALISVSLIGLYEDVSDGDLTAEVVRELIGWFGKSTVGSWRHLRTYRIGFAQPNQSPPTDLMKNPKSEFSRHVYLCGDYMTSATFDGALVSGRKAVDALLRDRALV